MQYCDFDKARRLIAEHAETLAEASLGMAEDWFWTAETVWKGGAFTRELFDGDVTEENKRYKALLEGAEGLDARNAVREQFASLLVGGISGSSWATPTLHLQFKDGSERRFDCCTQEGKRGPRPRHRAPLTGELSASCQAYFDAVPQG